jgi:parallel beta-helix repeat protein
MLRHTRFLSLLASLLLFSIAITGCQDRIASPAPATEPSPIASAQGSAGSQSSGCKPTGTGLTAKVVNQNVIGQTIHVGNCDVGAYFSENGVVKDATFKQPDADPSPASQRLIRVDGARVKVTGSELTVAEDYQKEMVHIALRSGAKGIITGNTLTGKRRTGILLNDRGTSGVVRKNTVVGTGPRPGLSTGIQVSFGASGTVKNNEVRDHWREGARTFCSTGIAAPFAAKVTITGNVIEGNDCGVTTIKGQPDGISQNTIAVTNDEASGPVGFAAGVLVAGSNNRVVQNDISGARSAAAGIWILGGFRGRKIPSSNNKLIGNQITGFAQKILDGGTETKLPPPFDPSK